MISQQTILVTGGAGYIGSHTCIALHKAGYIPIIIDNLSNSDRSVLDRMEIIMKQPPVFIDGDIRNTHLVSKVLENYHCAGVIHFAGVKAVGESVAFPLKYYDENVDATIQLLKAMEQTKVTMIVFSSSAAVYGEKARMPVRESEVCLPTSPYGRSKLMIETILEDLWNAARHWKIARLRYFNPVGAHSSGLIGEAPKGIPNNLMPYIEQVASGLREKLSVFGDDYPTRDGTAIRDYIHVMDLAEAHVAAVKACEKNQGMITANIGTGEGTSVLEMLAAFEVATGKKIPYQIMSRRKGDVPACWADTRYTSDVLEWKATRNISDICRDSWRWQQQYRKLSPIHTPSFATCGKETLASSDESFLQLSVSHGVSPQRYEISASKND